MSDAQPAPSARKTELLESAYRYALRHGLADLSLRPLAAAIGSSPRVLMFLFGNKDGLVRALLTRARQDELALLDRLRAASRGAPPGLAVAGEQIWSWSAAAERRPLLTLWAEGYVRSLVDPDGPWSDFARSTVDDWLELLTSMQPVDERTTAAGEARRTLVLAVIRGAMLDLLATGDVERTTAAVHYQLAHLDDARSGTLDT